jgi:hypothetical protein
MLLLLHMSLLKNNEGTVSATNAGPLRILRPLDSACVVVAYVFLAQR